MVLLAVLPCLRAADSGPPSPIQKLAAERTVFPPGMKVENIRETFGVRARVHTLPGMDYPICTFERP